MIVSLHKKCFTISCDNVLLLIINTLPYSDITSGGVTGALGKMTGAWGDAAAKLSFNTEFQQERKKVTGTFGEGVEGAAKVRGQLLNVMVSN